MQKTIAYAFMLAATLGLAACDKPSEDAAEDAREAQSEAQESMNDAAEQSNEAIDKEAEAAQERAEENRDGADGMEPEDTMPAEPAAPAPAPADQTNQ